MASSGNFCTINPLGAQGGGTPSPSALSNGNTAATIQTDTLLGNFGVTSGKWYWEWALTGSSTSGQAVGWANQQVNTLAELGYNSPSSATGAQIVYMYLSKNPPEIISDAPKSASSGTDSDMSAAIAQNDIIGLAADFDNDKWYFSINGSFTNMRSGQNPSDGSNPMCSASGGGGLVTIARTAGLTWFPAMGNWSAATRDIKVNFGQDSTFSGSFSAGGNADGNGFGDFKYSVPTGFLALCSANLPVSDDIDPAQTDDDYPSKQFNAVTWTGDGTTSRSISVGFQPDLIWFKSRSSAFSHRLYDTSRGINSNGGKRLFSNTTGAEVDQTSGQDISAVGTDGFTTGASANIYTNDTNDGGEHVAWCWRANGGTTASNTSGDINSTTQANTKGGFSIVTYTGNGSVAQSIGHGLSSGAPELIFVKNRSQADAWAVYHVGIGNSAHLILDTNAAQTTSSAYWGSFTPTTTLFKVGSDHKLNASSENYVAYLWHGVEGYSKFGSFVGNGNADGPFIYTGFRPRLIFIKNASSGTRYWAVIDSARSSSNLADDIINWDQNIAEYSSSPRGVDILSNGFKARGNDTDVNQSGNTMVYGAWGDVPFKYNNTF